MHLQPTNNTIHHCPKLRCIGHLMLQASQVDAASSYLKQLSHLSVAVRAPWHLPLWLMADNLPQLSHLVVESSDFGTPMLAQVAELSSLTCLQLNAGFIHPFSRYGAWAPLDVLAERLPKLQRLELVNYHSGFALQGLPALGMPVLSAFTQLKQLRLICAADPYFPLTQPMPTTFQAFYDALAPLRASLQQVEVAGYKELTAADLQRRGFPGQQCLEIDLLASRLSSVL